MTKKDYILAAQIIRNSGARGKVREVLKTEFARFFSQDNPRFDMGRWSRAVDDGMIQERGGAKEKPL